MLIKIVLIVFIYILFKNNFNIDWKNIINIEYSKILIENKEFKILNILFENIKELWKLYEINKEGFDIFEKNYIEYLENKRL